MKVLVVGFILLVLVSAGNCRRRDEGPLGWEPIQNLKDQHVQEIAEFAVTQHKAQSSAARLELRSVVKGETMGDVEGTNYRLVLATDPSGNYEAVVWEMDLLHLKNLTSFKLISKS